MNRQKGFTVYELLSVIFILAMAAGWIQSVIKLTECDFEPSYKAEVIYTIGVVLPPTSIVIGWVDVGK